MEWSVNGSRIDQLFARRIHDDAARCGRLRAGSDLFGLGGTGTFAGVSVDANCSLWRYTMCGDADLNGVVNFDDYSRIDNGFHTGGTDWSHGDFDYNESINFDDYALIDLAFNGQSSPGCPGNGQTRGALRMEEHDESENRQPIDVTRAAIEALEPRCMLVAFNGTNGPDIMFVSRFGGANPFWRYGFAGQPVQQSTDTTFNLSAWR